ncbi:Mitochondrial carrier protein [Penicillium argentinense]|uniref:Mitochondrial carrier protein n=1 Tax=Penicillium argentinense TaxID=1131581 RepID=A0A9W9KKJ5_9EURO|nr:Mitochondrial carrier protein [Penicillium argentinense]KAJ5110144.1 Mitochondrial carrier protein [Penicillium argentinense]
MAAHIAPQPKASEIVPQKPITTQWVSLVAGGVAGGVEAAVTYPFEYSKTRVQLVQSKAAVNISDPFKLILQVARHEGISTLYTGCSTLIIGTSGKAAVRFLSYDTIRDWLSDEKGKLSTGRGVLAGMAAGAVESVAAVTPTERIKTAMIDDAKTNRQFRSGIHAASVLVKRNSLGELYRGLVSTTVKQSATSAVRMGTYNILKETSKSQGITPNAFTSFAMGALAGLVTVYATQPFDTLKTRAQSVEGAGLAEATKSVLRDYGVRGLWRGSSMRLGRLLLSGGIVFSVYEQVSAFLSPV